MKNVLPAAFVVGCAIVFPACIHQDSTVVRDVERTKVAFENETAGRLFYDTLTRIPHNQSETSNTSVDLPIVLSHHRKVVTGPNGAFNRAVKTCDTNQDGKITELEAKIFSENVGKIS